MTMISVIIPAHNEGSVIARTLQAMTDGAEPGELDVIVVCNGCSDNTSAVARRFGAPVRVVETDVASKTHALNLGDETVESPDEVIARVRRALEYVPAERLVLAPDCGMKYLPRPSAFGKLSAMTAAAATLRAEAA